MRLCVNQEKTKFKVLSRSNKKQPYLQEQGVHLGVVTVSLLFNLFIEDQPTTTNTITGDFADNKALLAYHSDSEMVSKGT